MKPDPLLRAQAAGSARRSIGRNQRHGTYLPLRGGVRHSCSRSLHTLRCPTCRLPRAGRQPSCIPVSLHCPARGASRTPALRMRVDGPHGVTLAYEQVEDAARAGEVVQRVRRERLRDSAAVSVADRPFSPGRWPRDGCARSTVYSSGPLARIPTATAAVAGVGRSTKRVEIGSDVSRVGIGHTPLGHGGCR